MIRAAVTDLPHFALFRPHSGSILPPVNEGKEGPRMVRQEAQVQDLLRRLILYAMLLAASFVAGLGVWGGLRANSAPVETLAEDHLEQVAYVAAGAALDAALAEACAATGCDATALHHVIAATAAAMEPDELAEEIRAQERLERIGSPAEAMTAGRLVAFYRAEHDRR